MKIVQKIPIEVFNTKTGKHGFVNKIKEKKAIAADLQRLAKKLKLA